MAAVTTRPGDVVGMHFFNPAAVMSLVEVVAHVSTAPDVIATAAEVCAATGKHAVHCGDRAGLHRQRAAVPLPQRRDQDARGALRDGRRDRHGHEEGLRAADGPLRAAGRRRQRRVAGDPADALPGVPRAGVRPGADARAPGARRVTSGARPGGASAPTPGRGRVAPLAAEPSTVIHLCPDDAIATPAGALRPGGPCARSARGVVPALHRAVPGRGQRATRRAGPRTRSRSARSAHRSRPPTGAWPRGRR